MSTPEEKEMQLKKTLQQLILSVKDQLVESVEDYNQISIGKIISAEIVGIQTHSGAGGKTHVVEAKLNTTKMGVIEGGIVLKFTDDIESETKNATELHQLLKKRQQEWDVLLEKDAVPSLARRFPSRMIAPRVLTTIPEAKCLILEFLLDTKPALMLNYNMLRKASLIGYSLARFHGFKTLKPKVEAYQPLFNMLQSIIDEKTLQKWWNILETSHGGAEFLHGDSHLQNLLVSKHLICWIDAMLTPYMERMDDVGYALSHEAQEFIIRCFQQGMTFESLVPHFINNMVIKWVPYVLASYKATAQLDNVYENLPLDFFVGAHLIIRSSFFDGLLKEALLYFGKYFINQAPILYMLHQQ